MHVHKDFFSKIPVAVISQLIRQRDLTSLTQIEGNYNLPLTSVQGDFPETWHVHGSFVLLVSAGRLPHYS